MKGKTPKIAIKSNSSPKNEQSFSDSVENSQKAIQDSVQGSVENSQKDSVQGSVQSSQKTSIHKVQGSIHKVQDTVQKDLPEISYEINNYVYKKVFEEWLETRIVDIQSDIVKIHILKTNTLINCHISDLFPSTIETIRKFKITTIKPSEYFSNPIFIKISTDNSLFENSFFLDDLFNEFKKFIIKNKSTIYFDELEQFLIYFKNIFLYFNESIITEKEKKIIKEQKTFKRRRKSTGRFDTNKNSPIEDVISTRIRCHPIHLIRLSALWHFYLQKSLSDEIVIETGYEFIIYLVDWTILTYFHKE
ncbi:hypothetical protein M153_41450001019 [Pseudoloma neurophilia]|uniref:Uncharacterized protein n=1 Tax=Pseudoloma neurophilia TaxID=146866 RepID=A0A0R0LT05_9MICR|nr:hypothetical protein M153_41450001019 [Pseudoloma neurophilia]